MNRTTRLLARALEFGADVPRLNCLIYHRVVAEPDILISEQLTAETFEWHIRLLRSEFEVMPVSEAVARLVAGTLPRRAACVTFDDGYADNHDVAMPILRSAGLSACFFVATGFLDGGRMWNDTVIESVRYCSHDTLDLEAEGLGRHSLAGVQARRTAINSLIARLKHMPIASRGRAVDAVARAARAELPSNLMMSSAQVAALARAGMEIGGHTVNHPILTSMAPEDAQSEIQRGRERLVEITNSPVELFAYPNGRAEEDYDANHVHAVKSNGFSAAFTTAWGAAGAGADPFQLPRFTPWDKTPDRFLLRLVSNATWGRKYGLVKL